MYGVVQNLSRSEFHYCAKRFYSPQPSERVITNKSTRRPRQHESVISPFTIQRGISLAFVEVDLSDIEKGR